MQKRFKSCLIAVLVVLVLCVGGVAVMYFGGLCPPQGPWPTPPWCSGNTGIETPPSIVDILQNGECPPPGPWPMPPWCENPKTLAAKGENTSVTFWLTVPYGMDVSKATLDIDGREPLVMEMVGLLSYQVKTTVPGQEVLEYTYSINDDPLDKQYRVQITKRGQSTYDFVSADIEYMPVKGVFMADTWGKNYNFTWGEDTRKNIESSFDRVAALGAEEVYVADFYRAIYDSGSFELDNLDYHIEPDIFENDQRDQAMTREELVQLAEAAHARGLKIAWSSNFTFVDFGTYIGKDILAEDARDKAKVNAPKSEAWVTDFLTKWRVLLLDRAIALQAAGFDIMVISPHYHAPTYAPFDDTADEMWLETIQEVRKVFNGEIGYIVEGHHTWINAYDQQDWLDSHEFYNELDIPITLLTDFSQDWNSDYKPQSNSFEDLRTSIERYFDDIEQGAGQLGQNPAILFGCASFKDVFLLGNAELQGIGPEDAPTLLRKGEISPDFQYQADCYEAMLQASADRQVIQRSILKAYWWDDAMDPDTAIYAISISESIRNKPAEAVVGKWWGK